MEEIVKDILYCLSQEGQCGLHIAIEDGNLDDDDIKWCLNNLEENCNKEDIDIANKISTYLLNLEDDTRYEIFNKVWTIR